MISNVELEQIASSIEKKLSPLNEISESICHHTFWNGKRVRALRPFSQEDALLMDTVSSGDFLVNGFKNRDIQNKMFSDEDISKFLQRKKSLQL
jgi:hypothetical protein